MATVAQDNEHSSLAVTRAATSRSIAGRLESSSRASQRSRQETANLPPVVDTADTPACSEAQDARRLGAQGRLAMRSIGLDLGVRHIAFCEVKDGKVVDRGAVRSFSQLESRLGPKTANAVVGFEACREGWHVHDTLLQWGHRPRMLDTTRVQQIGVGQHKEKGAKDFLAYAIGTESAQVSFVARQTSAFTIAVTQHWPELQQRVWNFCNGYEASPTQNRVRNLRFAWYPKTHSNRGVQNPQWFHR